LPRLRFLPFPPRPQTTWMSTAPVRLLTDRSFAPTPIPGFFLNRAFWLFSSSLRFGESWFLSFQGLVETFFPLDCLLDDLPCVTWDLTCNDLLSILSSYFSLGGVPFWSSRFHRLLRSLYPLYCKEVLDVAPLVFSNGFPHCYFAFPARLFLKGLPPLTGAFKAFGLTDFDFGIC